MLDVPERAQVAPVLLAQDGSLIGEYPTYNPNLAFNIIAFDSNGSLRWVVPNERPKMATADGGVVAESGAIFDRNGQALSRMAPVEISWKGTYQMGSINSIVSDWRPFSTLGFQGGNLTGNGTAALHRSFRLNWCANNTCQLGDNSLLGGRRL